MDKFSRDLDRHITGNYGEDQFREEEYDAYPDVTGHEMAFLQGWEDGVYEYDPAEDGPECELITRILAHHPHYNPFLIQGEAKAYTYTIMLAAGAKVLANPEADFDRLHILDQDYIRQQVALAYARLEGLGLL